MFIIYLLHYSIYVFMLCIIPVQYSKTHLVRKYQLKFMIIQPDRDINLCVNSGKKILKQINSDIIGYVTFLKE